MQLFTEDIVERKDGSGMGIVARSWQEQPEADIPAEIADDPLLRPLLKGEVGVQSYPSGHREILPESSFNLLDRTTFVRGDFCKRTYDDIQSGVVLNLKIQVKVQHAITMEPVDLWFDKDEFVANQPLMLGDFVFYNDWVGQVEEIFSEALMHQSDSKVQPVYGLGGRFAIGEKCYAVTEASSTIPPTLDETSDVIIKVMPIAAAISWSAINQRLDSTTGHELKRPPQLWASQDLQQLVVMRSRGSVAGSIGERVVFKDPARIASLGIHPVLYKDHELNFEVPVDVMVIRLSRTSVEVLWQDGTREWVPATELIPHINPDEHECWPGDFVLWKGEDEKRIAIVQSVAAKERIATVRWYDSDTLEQVSVLDLDPHGPPLGEGGNLDAFGLRRGEFVLLHDSFTGSKVPMVPRIGELEPWVHDQPSRTPEGTLEGWRGELTSMALKSFGLEYMQHDRPSQIRLTADTVFGQLSGNETNRILPRSDILRTSSSDVIDWFGQVVDLTDSGQVVVSLPSSRLVQVPIHKCSLYRDIEDYQWDAESVANDDLGALYENDDQMSLGSWELEDAEERDDWSHMDTDSLGHSHHVSSNPGQFKAFAQAQAVMPGSFDPRPPTPLSDDDDQITRVSSSPSEGKLKNSASKLSSSIEEVAMLLDDAQSHSGTSGNDVSDEDLQTNWKRFEILSEAPADHAFFSVDPPQLSKQFLSRIAKEYRVLESTLPDTILVRAYEDRADLLRSLIIGPQNTPYQDAPFVIDWRLDGSFPQTPPIAHFLSWTNGNGRVNPNLYEEGKVCLSILGTWAGDRSESWSAARSSILQALVSIQGLVLVKEPYFCEPGFEKMRGTEEGRINSHLYSEKAYVLSRGFVRRALEIPLGGLEQEISWFYIKNGMLKKVLADAEQLISRSSSKVDQDDSSAISGLSAGGILALNRTLTKLRSLLHNLTAIQA